MSLKTSPGGEAGTYQRSQDEIALQRCKAARSLVESGEYGQGAGVLADFWGGVGTRPSLDNLKRRTRAEVLLVSGVLTGWIGHAKQIEGAQESAKDLIGESARIFESLGDGDGLGEARTELAYCYWRKGELKEARALLEDALGRLSRPDLRAVAILRTAIVDCDQGDLRGAISRLTDNESLFLTSQNVSIRARFHYNLGTFNKDFGLRENDERALDRARIEFAGAAALMEEIGHKVYLAAVLNQLGFLLFGRGEFREAHEKLDRARAIFARMNNRINAAIVDETRARAFFAEGRYREAEAAAIAALKGLKKGEANGARAEALITLGRAQARLGKVAQAVASLMEARDVAEEVQAGDVAALAGVTAIEELGGSLSSEELEAFYRSADVQAAGADLRERLRAGVLEIIKAGRRQTAARCEEQELEDVDALGIQLPRRGPVPNGFSLNETVNLLERVWIKKALREGEGKVSAAAKMLGFNHHGTLIDKMKAKHKDLLEERKPARTRRKSSRKAGQRRAADAQTARA